ncbi:GDP-mannose:glycolipid 4-beta-D-mannosyltransferase [Cellulomonas chitinilytica]|uniref:GDP-mannose:glycolipid 4-beta-D-mannosyltransferase n=1 Tax=Cellulomonas chitinilytica TaxID=398759 RepID=A0A919U3Q8_9CELL|nr:glycosyltransferase [Cellulomonas chitinilytica]GIG22672.1 GDP-mannose:glycolipid 4-beta-D-mannosyltransferase [Cellulomonas chitinilytica]
MTGVPDVLVVLHTLRAPDGTTRYVDHMLESAPTGVEPWTFSWRRALLARYDVLHVHWPETLVRHPSRPLRAARYGLLLLLLRRLRARRVAVLRTVHNQQPHESGHRWEGRALRRLDERTDFWITLNDSTDVPAGAAAMTIPHGHYVGRLADGELPAAEHGRLLFFGLLRRYKGVERLVDLVPDLPDDLTLRVVGKPVDATVADRVRDAARRSDRVTANLAFVPDDELAAEVSRAELVVLPYEEMFNSGAVLVALSLRRPVLVPCSPTTRALGTEVGPGWVHLYDGELQPDDVVRAVAATRAGERPPPDLTARSWADVGRRHAVAYRRALELRRATPRGASLVRDGDG